MISFIVSVYDRPKMLNACLATLDVQDEPGEIIVCGNHGDEDMLIACGLMADRYGATFKATGRMGCGQCYESANMAAKWATGEWLCFPSDDSLYVQGFSKIMLETAQRESADVVYCDLDYRQGSERSNWKPYTILEASPTMGRIDKTGFIIKRELFNEFGGFPQHPRFWSDGQLFNQLVIWKSIKMAKAPGCLAVHQ